MKRLFRIKYPKIAAIALAFAASYLLFSSHSSQLIISGIGDFGYLSIFLVGMLFSFGFTSPFAAGFFITLNPSNPLLACIVGGAGAFMSDLAIFNFIRFSFTDEFEMMKKEKLIISVEKRIEHSYFHRFKNYFIYSFAGLIIASPLPDEVGVIMLAGLTKINQKKLAVISLFMNSLGILVLLGI